MASYTVRSTINLVEVISPKALVVYDAQFGNTEKIAQALDHGIGEDGIPVACLNIAEVDPETLRSSEFLAVGGPTHAFGMSKPMKAFLEQLTHVDLRGTKAFAFDTKYRSRFAGSAAKGIERRLKKQGLIIIRSRSSVIVKGGEGPLDDHMEDTFRNIGKEIAEFL